MSSARGSRSHLLRAHIGERAEQLAHVGLPGRLRIAVGDPRQAEIENLGLAVFVHQDVARFQIAVDDAALMGMLDRFADLDHQRQSLARVQMLRFGVFDQGLPWMSSMAKKGWEPKPVSAVPAS